MSNSIQPQNSSELRPILYASLTDLPRIAEAYERGLIPEFVRGGGVRFLERTSSAAANTPQFYDSGLQEIDTFSEDLVLVRTDFRGFRPMRVNLDVRGCLYLHFRLDGLSDEQIPSAGRRRFERECFVLSATSHPEIWVRDIVGDAWRTVGIVCRPPAFAQQELRRLGEKLPEELRRFSSGEEIEFAFVGALTAEMRGAVQSLMYTKMPREIRNAYLRAKVVELVCLALARIGDRHEADAATALPVRLNFRDIEAIRRAHRLLIANSEAPPLGALARQVGINRNKLAFGFKRLFGVTVGEFDRVLRLERARRLLQQGGLPIRHIATLAGYEDPGSFSKAFKLEFGVLPSEWRGMDPEKVTEARFFGTPARHGGTG